MLHFRRRLVNPAFGFRKRIGEKYLGVGNKAQVPLQRKNLVQKLPQKGKADVCVAHNCRHSDLNTSRPSISS